MTRQRFGAIEGLRGWLAWIVVADHCLVFATPFHGRLTGSGFQAVLMFITVSGFVVSHLLLERPEPYGIYLTRRFFRLAPLFFVTCIGGFFAYRLQVRLLAYGFGNTELAFVLRNVEASQTAYFAQHLAAHLTMLSSAISHEVLPYSDYAFNMPAWSVSLEWQFYIAAPVLYPLLRYRALLPLAVALAVLGHWLFNRGAFGSYDQPGLLFASAIYFMVGIGSRLALPHLKLKSPAVALALSLALLVLADHKAMAIWALVFFGLTGIFGPFYRLALESRPVLYLGARSYSTYLSHFAVVVGCQWLWIALFGAPPGFLALLAMTVPVTFLASEILYRCVERPGIQLGAWLIARIRWTPPTTATGALAAARSSSRRF
jgi:peptidoglycan/LPS O-acetylase OafA/YrhL